MSEGRSRRQTKTPKKYADDETDHGKKQQRHVFRLLKTSEINKDDLLDEGVFLLWPEDNKWYPAEVRKVDARKKRADLFYTTTNEEETVELTELIDQKSIAFRESRPLSHTLKPDEIWDPEDGPTSPAAKSGNAQAASSEVSEEEPEEEDEEISGAEEQSDDKEADVVSEPSSEDKIEEPPLKEEGQPTSSSKRQRDQVTSPEEVQGRPKRQITLSNKARELMSENQAAQLQKILQGRNMVEAQKMEAEAIKLEEKGDVQPQGQDRFSSAEAYEQRLLSQLAAGTRQDSLASQQSGQRLGSLNKSQFYGKTSLPSQQDQDVRNKAEEQMRLALEKVAQEKPDKTWSDPQERAKEVEEALFNLYGNAGKDYKAKYRSLVFNLRDPNNPDLRARVLGGEISPDKLVQLSAAELASKELASWREEKEKEAMKNAVLDDVVASKFSTAAALASKRSQNRGVDWRDNTLATNSPPREAPKGDEVAMAIGPTEDEISETPAGDTKSRGSRPSQTTPSHSTGAPLAKSDSVRSPAAAPSGSGTSMPVRTSTTFDWSSIKATALREVEQPASTPAAPAEDDAGSDEYDPDSDHFMGPDNDDAQDRELADQVAVAASVELSERLWSGLLSNACPIPLPVSIDYLAGNPALATGLPPRQVEVKGRVEMEKVVKFMIDLKSSTRRILSLAAVRLSSAASTDEKAQWKELIQQYTAKGRCAVFPHNEMEYYLMPPIQLTRALLLSAGDRRLPARNLLLACVHPKNLVKPISSRGSGSSHQSHPHHAPEGADSANPTPAVGTPAKTPKAEELVQQAEAGKEAHKSAGVESSEPPSSSAAPTAVTQTAKVLAAALSSDRFNDTVADPRLAAAGKSKEDIAKELMMPQGIDLSNLGSLAAALGVTQGLHALANHQLGNESQSAAQPVDPRAAQAAPPPPSGSRPGGPNPGQVPAGNGGPLPQQNLPGPPRMTQQGLQGGQPQQSGPPGQAPHNPGGGFQGPQQRPPLGQDAQQPMHRPPAGHGLPPWGAGRPPQLQDGPNPPFGLQQHAPQPAPHFGNPGMALPGPPHPEPRPQGGQGPVHAGFQQQPLPQFMAQQNQAFAPPNHQQPNQMRPPQAQNPHHMQFRPPGHAPFNPNSRPDPAHGFQQNLAGPAGGGGGPRPFWNEPAQHLPGPPQRPMLARPDGGPRLNSPQQRPRPIRGGWRPRH